MEYIVFARISEGGIHLMAKVIMLMSARKPLPRPKIWRFLPKMLNDTIAGRRAPIIALDASLQAGRELAGNDRNCPIKPAHGKRAPEECIPMQNSARFLLPPAGPAVDSQKPARSSIIRVFGYLFSSRTRPLDD
jgi:hypothetical protein